MFESAEIDHVIDKATFAAEEQVLREALLEVQYAPVSYTHLTLPTNREV